MKSFQIYLIIGGVVLVAGLAVASISTYSITKQFLQGAVMIDSTLQPESSQSYVMIPVLAQQRLLLSLSGASADNPLQATITGPDGTRLATYNVNGTPFVAEVQTKVDGNETLLITNPGSSPVAVKGTMANLPVQLQPGGSLQNNPQLRSEVSYGLGVLAGIVLNVSGIVVLIIGVIKFARSRKSLGDTKTTQ